MIMIRIKARYDRNHTLGTIRRRIDRTKFRIMLVVRNVVHLSGFLDEDEIAFDVPAGGGSWVGVDYGVGVVIHVVLIECGG